MSNWTGKSKGNALGYNFVIATLRIIGLPATYLMVRVISFCYYLFSRQPKKAILGFYQTKLRLTSKESRRTCRKNFDLLAQSLLDKIALTIGKGGQIHYSANGESELINMATKGQGGFLLSAHFGNWDIAGNLLQKLDVPVNVVMLENEKENIARLLESQNATPKFNIIGIKNDLSHLVKIYAAFKNNELICMNVDRFIPGAKTVKASFFNDMAEFPEGPFTIIKKLKAKYSYIFSVKTSKFGYQFSATTPQSATKPVSEFVQEFALELEKKVSQNPEQWFNYYDYHNPQA